MRDFHTAFAEATGADELIIAHASSGLDDRLRSVELTAAAMGITPSLVA